MADWSSVVMQYKLVLDAYYETALNRCFSGKGPVCQILPEFPQAENSRS
jgi:hypothetical protein